MKRILNIALCIACAVTMCSCSGGHSSDRAHQLKIYNWSDYIDEDLLDEFEEWYYEQTGEEVEVIYQVFDINEVMLAKIERGQADYDVVCPSDYIIERMINHGMVLPLDRNYGNVPDYTKNVSPFVIEKFRKMNTPGKDANDYAVGYMWGTVGFIYNEKYVDRSEVSTWGAILNPKFEKQIFMKDAFRDVYSPLLLYLNHDAIAAGTIDAEELMYDVSDESIAKVEALLLQAKKNISGWEADFGKDLITQEKAWISWNWSGDGLWSSRQAEAVNVPLNYVIPKEGSTCFFDGWVIPKYAVNVKAANYFINFMCTNENAIRNMIVTGYDCVLGTPEILEYEIEQAAESRFAEVVDASYFFGPEADSVLLNPILYPDKSIIEKCPMMHDTDQDTEKLLKMWSRVKGDNLNTTIIVLLCAVVAAIVVWSIIKSRKNKSRRKGSKNRR